MLNKKEVERQRLVALGNVTNHGLKKSYEDFMLERRESDLIEYVDNMVHTAERTLRELKDYQRKVNDESYTDNTGKEKVVQIAKLPSADTLMSTLLGLLQSPMQKILGCLQSPMRDLLGVLKPLEEIKQ